MKKVLATALILFVMSIIFFEIQKIHLNLVQKRGLQTQNTISVTIHGQKFTVVVADTPALRTQGLSGTATLPYDGMLFVFNTSKKPSFWMKDMDYSLDFIWLDADKKVVDTSENISPQTFPNTISPNADSIYVLETKAGFTKEYKVQKGDFFEF